MKKALFILIILSAISLAIPVVEWHQYWGGADWESAFGMANDSSGNIYIAGITTTFGTNGSADALLVKYDSSSTQLWNRTWGGTDSDSARSIALDSSGNIYIAGSTHSFGEGNDDAFLVKFDSSGTYQWNRTWGGTLSDSGYGVATDSSGNIYIVGTTQSFSEGLGDAFIVKYDSSGNQLWNRTWGGANWDSAQDVAVDSSGNAYLAGQTMSFSIGSYDTLLVKYDENGTQLWNRTWGGTGVDFAFGAAVDSSNDIYMSGGTSSFGATDRDILILKYDSDGNVLWNATWSEAGDDNANGIGLDPSGDVYLAGENYGSCPGLADAIFLKFDSSGTYQWNRRWGGAGYEYGYGVVVDSSNNSYVAGHTESFGAGKSDAFLLKVVESGTDSEPPLVSSVSPTNTYKEDTQFKVTVSDNVGITNCDFYWEGFDQGAMSQISGDSTCGIWGYNYTPLVNGTYSAWANCSDTAGNSYMANTSIFVGDAIPVSWYRIIGTGNGGSDVATDSLGNAYATGYTLDPLSGAIAFLAKYDTSGNQQWNVTWGAGSDNAQGVVVDSSGHIYIAGYTYSFGTAGSADAFLAKYDSSGTQLWNGTWGGASEDYGWGVAADSSGNVYIAGLTQSFGLGDWDAFLVKYDSAGNYQWNRTWGGASDDQGFDVAADSSGNAYVVGRTQSFGAGGEDAFIVKYDSSGTQLWNRTWGEVDVDDGNGVALDPSGNVYLAGSTQSFGIGAYDAFLAKYDSSGNSLQNITWGRAGPSFGAAAWDVTFDPAGNIYISGFATNFGAVGDDALLVEFDSSGTPLWNRTWGGTEGEYGYGVALDPSGNIYLAGETYSIHPGNVDAFLVKFGSSPVGNVTEVGAVGVGTYAAPESPLTIATIFGLAIVIWTGLIARRH
jgi:uncharacterized delta-60 repeat protein